MTLRLARTLRPLEYGNEKGYLPDASVFRAEGILQDVNQYNDVNMTCYLE